MNCNECNKVVSYYTHESDMARLERTIHRLWLLVVILIVVVVLTNLGWIMYEAQYEGKTTTTTTEDISQYVDADGTAIVAGIGDAIYGYENQTNG